MNNQAQHQIPAKQSAVTVAVENQKAQKGRTALTVIGGTIGVVAIVLTLALSNGFSGMATSASLGMLRTTPISITKTALNQQLAQEGLESASSSQPKVSSVPQQTKDSKPALSVDDTIADSLNASGVLVANSVYQNDLESLYKHIESDESKIKSSASLVQYDYGVSPRLYLDKGDFMQQVYPSGGLGEFGIAIAGALGSLLGAGTSTNTFFTMPAEKELYENSYTVLAGRFPKDVKECVIVLDKDATTLSDYLLYQIGLLNHDELDAMVNQALLGEKVAGFKHNELFTYDDLLSVSFKLVHPAAGYAQNARYNNWTDMSAFEEFMKPIVDASPDLRVVGVVSYSGKGINSLSTGVGLSADLQQYVIETSSDYEVVKAQLADTSRNIFTGKPFEGPGSSLTLADLGIAGMFTFNPDALMRALAGIVDMLEIPDVSLDFSMFEISEGDIEVAYDRLQMYGVNVVKAIESVDFSLDDMPMPPIEWAYSKDNSEKIVNMASEILADFFEAFVITDESGYIIEIKEVTEKTFNEFVQGEMKLEMLSALLEEAQVEDEATKQLLIDWYDIDFLPYLQERTDSIIKEASTAVNVVVETALMELANTQFVQKITEVMGALGMLDGEFDAEKIMELLSDVVILNPNPSKTNEADVRSDLMQVVTSNVGTQDVSALVSLIAGSSQKSAEANLAQLGYVKPEKPTAIEIFTKDIEDRAAVLKDLDEYNEQMKNAGKTEKAIMFNDAIGSLLATAVPLIGLLGPILAFPGFLALIVFGLLLAATTLFDASESRQRFAAMVARGSSPRSIFGIVFIQALAKGFAAGIIGMIAILPVSFAISKIAGKALPNLTDVSFAITSGQAVIILVICLVISAAAALGPALRAKKNAVKDNAFTAPIPKL